jgi:hypothetical protein
MNRKAKKKAVSAPQVDMSQIEANLSLSFEERLIQHQEALNLLLALEKARSQLFRKPLHRTTH